MLVFTFTFVDRTRLLACVMVVRYTRRMQLRKYRWSKVYESAEEELVALLKQRQIEAIYWQGEDGEEVSERQFAVDTQLWCAEGQLVVTADSTVYSLQPGDVLDIPADTVVAMHVGFGGCAIYKSESHL